MNVHPLLLAKMRALHSIFFDQWRQVPLYRFPTFSPTPAPIIENSVTNNSDQQNFMATSDDAEEAY